MFLKKFYSFVACFCMAIVMTSVAHANSDEFELAGSTTKSDLSEKQDIEREFQLKKAEKNAYFVNKNTGTFVRLRTYESLKSAQRLMSDLCAAGYAQMKLGEFVQDTTKITVSCSILHGPYDYIVNASCSSFSRQKYEIVKSRGFGAVVTADKLKEVIPAVLKTQNDLRVFVKKVSKKM